MSLHGHATFVHFTHNVHICTCVTSLCKERDKVCQTRGPRWDHFSWKSNVSNCRGLFLPSLFNTWFLWRHFHIQALPTFIQTIGLTKYLFFHPWNAVHEKVVERGNSEPFSGHRGEWSACHLFLIQRHCVCSVCCYQTAARWLREFLSHTISYIFSQLFAQLYDKGHNGFTHSQCTSLQSNEGGILYKKKMVRLFFFFSFFKPSKSTAGF